MTEINTINKNNIYKTNWDHLSKNPNAIHIIEKNLDKIRWKYLSANPNAIHILEKPENIDLIDWIALTYNPNPNAIRILENNLDKID